jgi:hypothetical protein
LTDSTSIGNQLSFGAFAINYITEINASNPRLVQVDVNDDIARAAVRSADAFTVIEIALIAAPFAGRHIRHDLSDAHELRRIIFVKADAVGNIGGTMAKN